MSLMMANFKALEEKLNYQFQNQERLIEAFTHQSYGHENDPTMSTYQRLEFLGDSVIQLVITQVLLEKHPGIAEGILSKLRSSIVNEEILADLARYLGLGSYLLLGKGEEKTGGRNRSSLLSDVFEALFGTIYSESDIATVQKIFLHVITTYHLFSSVDLLGLDRLAEFDAKTRLQEIYMRQYNSLPKYDVTEVRLEKNIYFEAKLVFLGQHFTSVSKSKKMAEQLVAKQVLDEYQHRIKPKDNYVI
ncbi:MAG: ribonuclease III [Bacteriovoracaceae bacterium]|nr:ribonuclease III [Bacteriovoracaceae bacterium]